jgi:hypothetical protein
VPIVTNEIDIFELRNDVLVAEGEDQPTFLAEAGTWNTKTGRVTGISVSTFGDVAPIVSPTEARKLAKWLVRAAEDLDGAGDRKARPGSKPSHYEQDDEA